MVDDVKPSVPGLEHLYCPDCHSEMKWYRSMPASDGAPETIAHFFQCQNCNRMAQMNVTGLASDPRLPLHSL
jgi:hypothetical protein